MNEIVFGDNIKVMRDDGFSGKYSGKIKFIYIDPPYNTKGNLSYRDNFSNWKEFIRERIQLSRKYLREDGLIFISIDDNEFHNLNEICNDVFGKRNCIGTFITNQAKRSNAKFINIVHEYVICYAKDISKVGEFQIKRVNIPEDRDMIERVYRRVRNEFNKNGKAEAEKLLKKVIDGEIIRNGANWLKNYNNLSDDGRIYYAVDLSMPSKPRRVDIPEIGIRLEPLKTRGWVSDSRLIELYTSNRLVFRGDRPYEIVYLEDSVDNISYILNFYSRFGTNDLKKLGLYGLFDHPKPVEMIKYFLYIVASGEDIVMDFFAGSGTTAQAVYEYNRESGNRLRYVLIQLAEDVREESEVFKRCEYYGINPNIKDILLYRINKYLGMGGMNVDYLVRDII